MTRQPKIRKCGKMSFGVGLTYLYCSVNERFKTGSGRCRSFDARRRRVYVSVRGEETGKKSLKWSVYTVSLNHLFLNGTFIGLRR
jgi:hypothetical protein